MTPDAPRRGRLGRRIGIGLLLVPVVEIVVAVVVAHWIGWPATLLLVLLASTAGLLLLRREGAGALRRWRSRAPGTVAAAEVGDTGMRVAAATLLLLPGLVTGVAGLLLLVPPVRSAAGAAAGRRLRRELGRAGRRVTVRGEVVDAPAGEGVTVTTWVDDDEPPRLPPGP